MKKYFAILFALAIVSAMLCGCTSNKSVKPIRPPLLHGVADFVANNTAPADETKTENPGTQPEESDEAIDVTVENEDGSTDDDSVDGETGDQVGEYNEATPVFSFTINDREYFLGMSCEKMLSDFEVIEVDGFFDEDGMVSICEKIDLRLADENGNEFIIVVRNDSCVGAVSLEECIMHEVMFEAINVESMDMFKVIGEVDGSSLLPEWKDVLGDDYSEFTSDAYTDYSWMLSNRCWVDVCIHTTTNVVEYVQMIAY